MKATKIIALLLALATALSLASFGAFADDVTFEYLYDADPFTSIGSFEVTPLATVDVTGYCFTPDAAGYYCISLLTEDAVLHNVTGSPFFANYGSVNEEGMIFFNVSEAAVGSSCLFGVQYNGTVTVLVEVASNDDPTPPEPTTEDYENTVAPENFTLALEEGQSLTYVNINEEHTAVLGDDGFYHLDSADGPILYFDLKKAPYALSTIVQSAAIRDAVRDEDGNIIKIVNFTDAVIEFINCADDNIYPLCYDLIHIIQTHGEAQGWYDADGQNCWLPNRENLVEDTAWMYACAYIEGTSEDDDSSEDVSDDEPSEVVSDDETTEDVSVEDGSSDDVSSEEEVAEPSILGDVNGDGTVNSLDAAQILKYDAKLVEFSVAQLLVGDVNGDGAVNSLDAAQVLKYDAKLIDGFEGAPAEDEPEYGTEELPHPVMIAGEYIIAPGATVYFDITHKNGMTLVVTAGDFSEECAITDINQLYSFTNEGEETVVLTLEFAMPAGNMENPIELVMGENLVEVSEGNNVGVFFTWTAEEAGTLTIQMPEGDWTYAISNLTSYQYGDTQWSDSDPVVATATVEVSAGDKIQLMFNSYDPANPFTEPEAQFTVVASFE